MANEQVDPVFRDILSEFCAPLNLKAKPEKDRDCLSCPWWLSCKVEEKENHD